MLIEERLWRAPCARSETRPQVGRSAHRRRQAEAAAGPRGHSGELCCAEGRPRTRPSLRGCRGCSANSWSCGGGCRGPGARRAGQLSGARADPAPDREGHKTGGGGLGRPQEDSRDGRGPLGQQGAPS
ncbi:hypothetical protein NDU88_001568 [Pleurodeles waltl]|uniref:Uncharacterized protein n=1 Tax=Pleurodeles waltl TaxID=8319 RepID=A0AAV7TJ23_PLEWA|nr:hypothetical protein NDU88_001568 [Pleurodeles waltl]